MMGTGTPPLLPLLLLLVWSATGLSAAATGDLVYSEDDAPLLGCRDENNNFVQWYVLNNLPDTVGSSSGNGDRFMYFSESTGSQWEMSKKSLNDPTSPTGLTVTPVNDNRKRKNLIYVFYSDEPPVGSDSESFTDAHAKGVVAFDVDSNSGFWLVHTIRFFPEPPGENYEYFYPGNAYTYGQSFLCMTLNSAQIEAVATQLLQTCPAIYDKQMDPGLYNTYPEMASLIGEIKHCYNESMTTPVVLKTTLQTPDGKQFTSFAKTMYFPNDLYIEVADDLETGLATETWQNGSGGKLPSYCYGSYHVENVQQVTANTSSGESFTYTSTKDHSKWAVSNNAAKPWVCIGDINRMQSQAGRGGGTVCHQDTRPWTVYSQMVVDWERC